MTNILVVGARGFIGHWVLHDARAHGDATGVTRRRIDHLRTVATDVPEALGAAFDEVAPDVVINAAGVISGTAADLEEANVALVERLLGQVRSRGTRLVQIGSAAEVGSPDTAVPLREDVVCTPLTDYGRTKHAATELITDAHADGVAATVARVFNTVGPRQTVIQPLGDVVRRMRELPASGGRIEVGNAEVVRDFVAVDYVARAVVALALAESIEPIVNVCSGQGRSVRELVAAMLEAKGLDAEVVSLDQPAIPVVIGDPTLLHKLTGLQDTSTTSDLAKAAVDSEHDPEI